HNFARGIPRLINIACDFLLLSAFVEEKKEISQNMVREVIDDLERENRYWEDEISEEYNGDVKVPGKKSEKLNFAMDQLRTELENRETINLDARLNEIIKQIEEIKYKFPKELKEITPKLQGKKAEEIRTRNESKNLLTKIFYLRRLKRKPY
ncbi:MAG: hypothetical protein AB1638_02560, partial [Nitrospirota bacterium]